MEFREPAKKNVAVFTEETAMDENLPDMPEASMLDIPAARPGGFREGSRRMTPSSSAQIAVHGFAFALILKPGLSVRPLKI
jgi:hypothetical protein